MTASFFFYDRATHLKIVSTALALSTIVILVGISARTKDNCGLTASARTNGAMVKAGKPAVYSTRGDLIVR